MGNSSGNHNRSSNGKLSLKYLGYAARIVHEYIGDTILILATDRIHTYEASKACGRDGDLAAFQNDSVNSLLITQQVLYSAILSHKNELALHITAPLSSLHMGCSAIYEAACRSGNIEFIDAIYSASNKQDKGIAIARILQNAIMYYQYDIAKKYIGELKRSRWENLPLVWEVFRYVIHTGRFVYVKIIWEAMDVCFVDISISRSHIATSEIYDYLSTPPRRCIIYDT